MFLLLFNKSKNSFFSSSNSFIFFTYSSYLLLILSFNLFLKSSNNSCDTVYGISLTSNSSFNSDKTSSVILLKSISLYSSFFIIISMIDGLFFSVLACSKALDIASILFPSVTLITFQSIELKRYVVFSSVSSSFIYNNINLFRFFCDAIVVDS